MNTETGIKHHSSSVQDINCFALGILHCQAVNDDWKIRLRSGVNWVLSAPVLSRGQNGNSITQRTLPSFGRLQYHQQNA